MYSTGFETNGSSSERRLYMQVWYYLFTVKGKSSLSEDEPWGSKPVEIILKY